MTDPEQVKGQVETLASEVRTLVGILSPESKAHRFPTIMSVLSTAIATTAVAVVSYWSTLPPDHDAADATRELQTEVRGSSEELERRTEALERKLLRLGERSVEQEVQVVDGLDFIGQKIDAAHPKQADTVEPPESFTAAKERVRKIKRAKAVDKLFGDVNPDRPLENGR